MEIKNAKRLDYFETGIFAALDAKKDELLKQGRKIYNLSIGTPDFEPPKTVIDALKTAADDPKNWKYTLIDSPELLDAVVCYYKNRFGVTLSRDEITAVHGTQEGMGHLGTALLNDGDTVLLPDPGYPVFEAGAVLGGAKIHFYPLLKENNFLPKLSDVPEEILYKTKYIVISYPSNPCGATAGRETYEEVLEYAKKYDFLVINDNAYSDIIFDGREAISFLSLDGAKEAGAEFFSLSKSFNVTGARISFLIGNKKIIDAVKLLRTQYDFGMFYPVQAAAIAAMNEPRERVEEQCMAYQRRRDVLCGGLRNIGWNVSDSQGTMFVWLPLPEGYSDSWEFCEILAEKTGVLGTPGAAFGPSGEGYIRLALVLPETELAEIVDAIDKSGILKGN